MSRDRFVARFVFCVHVNCRCEFRENDCVSRNRTDCCPTAAACIQPASTGVGYSTRQPGQKTARQTATATSFAQQVWSYRVHNWTVVVHRPPATTQGVSVPPEPALSARFLHSQRGRGWYVVPPEDGFLCTYCKITPPRIPPKWDCSALPPSFLPGSDRVKEGLPGKERTNSELSFAMHVNMCEIFFSSETNRVCCTYAFD